MPKMDDGPTDGSPGRPLRTVSATLSEGEAQLLLEALRYRAELARAEPHDSVGGGWHHHINDRDGDELTIWIGEGDDAPPSTPPVSTPPPVQNDEALTSIYGRWPSFHDAEVLALRLERHWDGAPPSLEVDVFLCQTTAAISGDGTCARSNEHIATLRFVDVDNIDLAGFNAQNVIFDLHLARAEDGARLAVRIDASYGLGATFDCSAVTVVNVAPAKGLGS